MERRTAPATFATRGEAADYLATVRADMVRGLWRAPGLGTITVAAYADGLLAVRVDLAPKTRQLYGELLRLWIDAPHALPTARHGSNRTIHLGSMELGALSVAVLRDWYAAAIHTTDQRAATRRDAAERKAARSGHPARDWARAQGMEVAASGRHVEDLLAGRDQPLGQRTACSVGPLDGPDRVRPLPHLTHHRGVTRLVQLLLHSLDQQEERRSGQCYYEPGRPLWSHTSSR
jgi:hypothetical protein